MLIMVPGRRRAAAHEEGLLNSILLASLATLTLGQNAGEEIRLLRQPAVFGDTVVFTYAGDLWTSSLNGGIARRLTSHPGNESNARFSPDGKWIAFSATYDGNPDVYVMPSEGGEPKRLTFEGEPETPIGWTPDGKVAYKTIAGAPGAFVPRLRIVGTDAGFPQDTAILEIDQGSFSADGKTLVYNRRPSHQFNWRRYRGGTQGVVSFYNLETNAYSEIPHGRENSWFPMYAGGDVYYVSDKNEGTVNLYKYTVATKRVEQVTRFADADIKWPSTDGKTIVFERDGVVYAFDIASKAITRVQPRVIGDKISMRPQFRRFGTQISNISLSPSGNRVAVEARGELFSVPARAGETRNVSNTSGTRERMPQWSPDGQTIAYLSDAAGEFDIYTMPQMGGESKKLTNGEHNILEYRWSPDGKMMSFVTVKNEIWTLDPATKKTVKVMTDDFNAPLRYDWAPDGSWIAYIGSTKNLFSAVFLYDVKSGKSTQVTEGYYRDDDVAFDMNGKYLYFISSRTFNPTGGVFEFDLNFTNAQRVYVVPLTADLTNPLIAPGDEEPTAKQATPPTPGAQEAKPDKLKIDLDGLSERAIPLPWAPGNYGGVGGVDGGCITVSDGRLLMFDLDSRQPMEILSGFSNLALNAKKSKIAYMVGPQLFIVDLRPGIQPGQGRVNTDNVAFLWDPKAEWKQIFNESWRFLRDRFYAPNFTGVNWNAVKAQYEKMLPYVTNRADLNYVIGLMIGELGTSHAYVQGGELPGGGGAVAVGSLAADFARGGDYLQIKKIYRGDPSYSDARGPLAAPGVNVKEGEYLIAIDGKPVRSNTPPASLLQSKVGVAVTLTVNTRPSSEGARSVVVRPIASDLDLRYSDWVENNRKKVAAATGGRVGYMHVPDTQFDGMIGFIRGYYSQSDKEAMIVDERFNGGGFIPTMFVEKLARKQITAFRQRNGNDVAFPPQTPQGPMAMLVNSYAGSGGDMFPWLFKEFRLGPLIGTRTWGGLVGITGSAPLVDGGFLSAPEFGLYDNRSGKWIAENTGVDPDIQVDARPDLLAAGKDPELEKAIEHILNELKKPRPTPKRPEFPDIRVGRPGN